MNTASQHSDHGSRMSAAWAELGTRMSLRQNVIQIYVTVAIGVFGFYFSQYANNRAPMGNLPEFLALSITLMTFISAVLIGVHDRVIANLKVFISTCEREAANTTGYSSYVSYFADGNHRDTNPEGAAHFHSFNQYTQKIAFLMTFVACDATALAIATEEAAKAWILAPCWISLAVSSLFTLLFQRFDIRPMHISRPQKQDRSSE